MQKHYPCSWSKKQPWRSHSNAICGDGVAKHRELGTTSWEIVAPKPDLDARAKNGWFWSTFKGIFKRKITSAKMEKICWQITIAAFMQPLQNHCLSPAAKDKQEARVTQRLQCDLQRLICKNTIELRATASVIVGSKPILMPGRKKNFFEAIFKMIFRRKITSAVMEGKKTRFLRNFLENSIGNSSTSTTWNPMQLTRTILQLQNTMEFCPLHTSRFQTSHFTLHTSTLRSSHAKLKLHIPLFILFTSHCFLHMAYFTLHSLPPHITLL